MDELPAAPASFSCSTPCRLSVLLATLATLLTLAFLISLAISELWGKQVILVTTEARIISNNEIDDFCKALNSKVQRQLKEKSVQINQEEIDAIQELYKERSETT